MLRRRRHERENMFFRKLLNGLGIASGSRSPSGKAGARAYVIGDVHGCRKLLDDLLGKIEADLGARPPKPSYLVFLGDLIDRGPDSAGVLERLRNYRQPALKPIFLAGNHEEFFLRVLNGETGILDRWLAYGGRECVTSYGICIDDLATLPEDQALSLVRRKTPVAHHQFLESFADTFRFGDYLFVHAGIRPGISLEEQSRSDLRWIREPFLADAADHGFVVVHGHTIVDSIDERPNRIGIDTGAYQTGVLTALVIEGAERRVLATDALTNAASA